uniref:Uncharacterized protein n=1 Tax=mine drainage metagenome TaxID=410659 RepID=E6PQI5_9ZZZZ
MKPDEEVRVVAVMRGDPNQPESIQIEGRQDGKFLNGLPKSGTKYQTFAGVLVKVEPQQRVEDGTKTVKISAEAYARLRRLRQRGESASQCMERMIYAA